MARSGREVVRLSPDDVVRIMQRVGFSDDQILDLGPDLYNALLLSGAAEVFYGKRTEMIFLVSNRQVQIQSHSRGTFVYDVPDATVCPGLGPGQAWRVIFLSRRASAPDPPDASERHAARRSYLVCRRPRPFPLPFLRPEPEEFLHSQEALGRTIIV